MLELSNFLIAALRKRRLVYVASPYSKYDLGIEAAFEHVCIATAQLIKEKIPVYSPIAHTHPIAMHGGLDPLDHKIWLPANEALIAACDTLLVVQMPTWEISYGIRVEIEAFEKRQLPIYYVKWSPSLPLG